MVEGSYSPCLSRKSFENLSVCNLDSDQAIETRIARAVDFAHAARAKRRQDFVRA